MDLFLHILLLIAGLFLVIKGGDIFVDASIYISKKFKIPTIIVGATVVSIATTLPELIVSTIAAAQGSFDLAVGNAVGSIICNTALICGLSIAIVPVVLKEKSSIFKYLLLIGTCLLLLICSLDYNIAWWESLIFIVLFVVFMVYNILDAKKQMGQYSRKKRRKNKNLEDNTPEIVEPIIDKNNDGVDDRKVHLYLDEEYSEKPKSMWLLIFLFILGAGMIAGGAFALVEGAKFLAMAIGISESFVGLTIVAIGTSLPELITTITAIKKKDTALGYGNVIGANTLNVTLIMGVCGLISGKSGLPLTKYTLLVSIPLMLVLTGVFVLPLIFKNRSYRWQGITLLSLYGAYFIFLLVMSILGIAL